MSDQWWLCTRLLYDYDQWWLCAIQNVAIVKISFSSDQCLLQQTTKITPMYLLHTYSTKKIKIQYNIKWKYHCHNSGVSFLPEVMQIWVWKQLWICGAEWNSVQTKSKTLWMGGEMQEIYENNSILRSSSILYNSINLISSNFKRLTPLRLTPRQCENSF